MTFAVTTFFSELVTLDPIIERLVLLLFLLSYYELVTLLSFFGETLSSFLTRFGTITLFFYHYFYTYR